MNKYDLKGFLDCLKDEIIQHIKDEEITNDDEMRDFINNFN